MRRLLFSTTLLFMLSAHPNAQSEPSVFGSVECQKALKEIRRERAIIYALKAEDLGHEGREIDEYIERAIRRSYFKGLTRDAAQRLNGTKLFISYLKAQRTFLLPKRQRKDAVLATSKLLEELAAEADPTLGGRRPILALLVEAKAPESLADAAQIESFMTLQLYLSNLRAEVSKGFRDHLPTDKTIADSDPAAVAKIVEDLSQESFARLQSSLQSASPNTGKPNFLPVSVADYPSQLSRVLNAPSIPPAIKEELTLQKNFEEKYQASPSQMQRQFVAELVGYFLE